MIPMSPHLGPLDAAMLIAALEAGSDGSENTPRVHDVPKRPTPKPELNYPVPSLKDRKKYLRKRMASR